MAIIFGENDGSDSIEGTDSRDIIYGGSPYSRFWDTGDDLIEAEDGADDLYGGDGDDELKGEDGDDHLVGGPDDDILSGGDDDDRLFGDVGSDSLNGGEGDDFLDGLEDSDELIGGSGEDVIHADAGDFDAVDGGADTDLLIFHAERFTGDVEIDISDPSDVQETSDGTEIVNVEQLIFFGGAGDDRAIGGELDDQLRGAGGSDDLRGGEGEDLLIGGKDADILKGHDDDDDLTGGAGADTFVFGDNDGRDLVRDFRSGFDTIDLTTVDDVDSFGDLDLTDLGSSVEVDYGSGSFVLAGIGSVGAVDSDDFIFA